MMHTYMHTCRHTYIHRQTYIDTHAPIWASTGIYSNMCICTYIYIYIYIYIDIYVSTLQIADVDVRMHAYIYIYIYICTHLHCYVNTQNAKHNYLHAPAHTRTYTHIFQPLDSKPACPKRPSGGGSPGPLRRRPEEADPRGPSWGSGFNRF